jgi:hypothetical protein
MKAITKKYKQSHKVLLTISNFHIPVDGFVLKFSCYLDITASQM